MLLRGGGGAVWRLAWTKDGPRRFAVPAGDYAWMTYRLIETAWHVSATGTPLGRVAVRPGERAVVSVVDGIALRLRGDLGPRSVRGEVQLGAPEGGGLSIYRDGRRIPLTCEVVDAAGRSLGSGPVGYG